MSTSAANNFLSDLWSGLSQQELAKPVGSLEEKWKLLPAFLQLRGLVKQHIDSYNYFIQTEMKQIMLANQKVTSDVDPNFFLK
jgi:DNA-directed RNA polymerase III subunit RPC2